MGKYCRTYLVILTDDFSWHFLALCVLFPFSYELLIASAKKNDVAERGISCLLEGKERTCYVDNRMDVGEYLLYNIKVIARLSMPSSQNEKTFSEIGGRRELVG